jgi:hypothetical protein
MSAAIKEMIGGSSKLLTSSSSVKGDDESHWCHFMQNSKRNLFLSDNLIARNSPLGVNEWEISDLNSDLSYKMQYPRDAKL